MQPRGVECGRRARTGGRRAFWRESARDLTNFLPLSPESDRTAPEPTPEAMALNSAETETAAAPVAEVPVVEKTDSSPAEPTSEPAPAEASKPVSRQLSATPAACQPSIPAARAARAPARSQRAR